MCSDNGWNRGLRRLWMCMCVCVHAVFEFMRTISLPLKCTTIILFTTLTIKLQIEISFYTTHKFGWRVLIEF
jgi:hypothetical protein